VARRHDAAATAAPSWSRRQRLGLLAMARWGCWPAGRVGVGGAPAAIDDRLWFSVCPKRKARACGRECVGHFC
jgi:hypothetical protein